MALWLVLTAQLGCVEDRVLLRVPTRVQASASALTLEGGATVTLEQATWPMRDLILEGPTHSGDTGSLLLGPFISTAHAHPGHEGEGSVQGELPGSWTLDLLSDQELDELRLYEGEVATGSLSMVGPVALKGQATVDGMVYPFDLAVALDAEVLGVPLEAQVVETDPPSALVLSFDLAHALSFLDLTGDTDGDGVLSTADAEVAERFTFGVVSTPTTQLTLED